MGRLMWLPWLIAFILGEAVAAVGWPDWTAAIVAIVAFVGVDSWRRRSTVAVPPLIRSRREAWSYALGEPFALGFGCLGIVYIVTGWESSLPGGVWILVNLGVVAFVQFSGVVERRAGGFSRDPKWMGRARREAWGLVRSGGRLRR